VFLAVAVCLAILFLKLKADECFRSKIVTKPRLYIEADGLPGFGLVASRLGLEAAVARADLVLTGEGSLDGRTL
jgi:Glycerate kinase family